MQPTEKSVEGLMRVIDISEVKDGGNITSLRIALESQEPAKGDAPKNYLIRWNSRSGEPMPERPVLGQCLTISAHYYQYLGSPGMITRIDKLVLNEIGGQ